MLFFLRVICLVPLTQGRIGFSAHAQTYYETAEFLVGNTHTLTRYDNTSVSGYEMKVRDIDSNGNVEMIERVSYPNRPVLSRWTVVNFSASQLKPENGNFEVRTFNCHKIYDLHL